MNKAIRVISLILAGLLSGAAPGLTQESFDGVRFDLYPLYAIDDDRISRLELEPGTDPGSVFYLWGNRDLGRLLVAFTNVGIRPITLEASPEVDWFGSLRIRGTRDGRELAPGELTVEIVERSLLTTHYYREGERLSNPQFSRARGWSAPISPYDETRAVREPVDDFPSALEPYQGVEATFDLRGEDGRPLPDGRYELSLTCDLAGLGLHLPPYYPRRLTRRLTLVVAPPAEPYQRVDSAIVRARYHWQSGRRERAIEVLERVSRRFPTSLEALAYLATYHRRSGDLAAAVETLERLEELAEVTSLRSEQRSLIHDYDPASLERRIRRLEERMATPGDGSP